MCCTLIGTGGQVSCPGHKKLKSIEGVSITQLSRITRIFRDDEPVPLSLPSEYPCRMEGRTEVPGKESIEALAAHQATMIIFLSVGMIEKLVEKLKSGYSVNTPVAVVYKASWPEQKIIRGTLETIADMIKKEGINKTALVTVGDFLGDDYELSKLYDKSFTHEYSSAKE